MQRRRQEHLQLLGEVSRRARNRMGLTQEALAAQTGIDVRTIIKIEQADTNPFFTTLYSLIQALKIDPRTIFCAEQDGSAPIRAQLMAILGECTEREAQVIMDACLIILSAMRGEDGYQLLKR